MRDTGAMGRNPGRNYVVTEWDRRRIKAARAKKGVSLRVFAERLACGHDTLWRIERGDIATTPLLREIYKALRIPVRLLGKPDPDEAELLASYRALKAVDPNRAATLLLMFRKAAM